MSYLKKLGLYGIRSYGDKNTEEYEEITFFKPLTLILGNNGAGKSTIIESLKLITTGSFPPNSDKGKTFIKDPRLMGTQESQGSISLIFKAINQKQILVRRLFQVRKDKNDKMTFDSKDATIKVRDKVSGKDISVDHKCFEIEKQIPQLLGVSKAVFENVIFCHQDESLWPFGDSATLKNIFDELFDTKQVLDEFKKLMEIKYFYIKYRFTKLQESLVKQQKEIKKELNENKIHLQHFKQRYDEAISLKQNIAKEAEDLYEQTLLLQTQRSQYLQLTENEESEANVRERIEELNKEIFHCQFTKEVMVKTQAQILQNCKSKYFINEDPETLKKIQDDVRVENKSLKEQKEQLDDQIENDRREIEKLKLEIEQISSSDKTSKQIHGELKILKQKLNEIMSKQIESEDIILEEAQSYKEKIDKEYENESRRLKGEIELKQQELEENQQQQHLFQVEQATLNQSKQHSLNRIATIHYDLKSLLDSNTPNALQEAITNLEASKNNSQQYTMQINGLQEEINKIKEENVEFIRQISIINQQSSIRNKQLEYQSIQSAIKEYNQNLTYHQNLYESYQLPSNEHLSVQKKQSLASIQESKLIKSKIESETSKLNGKLEHLEDQETAYDQKLSTITQTFKESNLLSIIASSDSNNADFDTKYKSIKEDIEMLNRSITEKETCLMIDEQVLKYCSTKNKCKFCKSDVNQQDLSKISKSQEDRTKRAQKELQQCKEDRQQRLFEKKTLKTLKEQYELYQDYKQKVKKNNQEIKDINAQLSELSSKYSSIISKIQQQEEHLVVIEKGISSQMEIIKIQKQIYEKEKQSQRFLSENPKLLDIDNQTIISIEQAEQIHSNYNSNNSKLEFLNNQLLKENQKKSNYNVRVQHWESERERMVKKLQEEKERKQKLENEKQQCEEQNNINEVKFNQIQNQLSQLRTRIPLLSNDLLQLNQSLQQLHSAYDQSKTLISEYLPKYQTLYSQYKELKAVKGKQKNKIQESQLQQLQERLSQKEKQKNENELKIKEIIESLREQISELETLTEGIKYVELSQSILLNEQQLISIQELLLEQTKTLQAISQNAKINQEKLSSIKGLEETCKYRKLTLDKNYSEAIAKYDQSEEKYCRMQVEQEIKNGLYSDISVYLEELDKTLINYHKEKMQQINKCIADTWRKVYQGRDILKVEIKAEEAEGRGKKVYNYRIVMFIQNEYDKSIKEIEMKGRCSAGQKVLASIIIRLALAEAFTINCGILALDEPTTNLDKVHAHKLGEQLCDLIQSRKGQDAFQLIIISHDKDFINLMQQRTHCNDFYQIYKVNGCSKIERRTYKNALMNKSND